MNEHIRMDERETAIRESLSENARKDFDDMYYCRILGAANNIRSIGRMYRDLGEHSEKNNDTTLSLIAKVEAVNSYFIEKRGASSYAIPRAISIMTSSILSSPSLTLPELSSRLIEAEKRYKEKADGWNRNIREHLGSILKGMEKVLLFDYSSTVNLVLEKAAEDGRSLDVFVPESRILDGGHLYVKNGIALGHRVHYLPDAAIMEYIKGSDGAFIGAESFYSDGTVMNTIGSDLVARLSKDYGVPLYVPTQLIKSKPISMKTGTRYSDSSSYFGLNLTGEEREKCDLAIPGLIAVEPEYITAFITERGIIAPCDMEKTLEEEKDE